MEISEKSIEKYWKTFGECGYNDPGEGFFVSAEIDGEERYFSAPKDETDEKFLDRIERSEKAGRNLFAEEWEKMPTDYSEVVL